MPADEFVLDHRLERVFGTKNMYACYAITTERWTSVPANTRGGVAIKFPTDIAMGLIDLSLFDACGNATNRLWNISLYPTARHAEVLACDGGSSYTPQVIWAWPRGRILEMFDVTMGKALRFDLSAMKDAGLQEVSLFIHCSTPGDGTTDYWEINLNCIAIAKREEAYDPIVF